MAQELIYTSASHGLLPGSSGFCTVARTVGVSPVLQKLLESRSGYRHLFPPQSEKAGLNPVNWVHATMRLGQTPTHILSRIGDAGLDYTKRSNLIAHHLILGQDELLPGGPAAILAQPGLMLSSWNQPPTEFAQERPIPGLTTPESLQCTHWEQVTGDAGWGGVLAESVIKSRSAYLLYEPGTDLLPLFAEAIALVPESLRWKITFSTYVREIPPGATFLWKGILAGTPEAEQARANKGILLIDLTTTNQGPLKNPSVFVKTARTGVVAPPPVESAPLVAPPPIPEEASGCSIAPPVDGGTYDIDESSTKKRKRFSTGTWSSRYESQSVTAEKERKARRIFITIMVFSILAILVLLTLLGDEFLNNGGMRKGVLESFGIGRQTADDRQQGEEEAGGRQQAADGGEQVEELIDEPEPVGPTEEELEELRRIEEVEAEALRLEEEARLAELERLQKEAEEEHERLKAEMRQAFATIPAAFLLAEPWEKPFGGIELPKNLQREFAPLFPYRDYVQLQWIPLLTPRGWRYHLEKVPSTFLDDPFAQWNLIAHLLEEEAVNSQRPQRSLNLATLRLGEDGLEVEWRPEAGLESNLTVVNKLPFSYLRLTFGPNAITEFGPGREEKPLPVPKRFAPDDDFTEIDFTKSVWFKEISLWLPVRDKPFALSSKGTITRPNNPVERFDNVFARDRYRVALDKLDIPLLLEVSVQPETAKNAANNITAICEAGDVPWRKMMTFNVEPDSDKNPPVIIQVAVEASPEWIEFRDTSQETQAEAIRQRTTLTRTIEEKTKTLGTTKIDEFRSEPNAAEAFDLFKRSLQRDISDTERKRTQVNELFLAIPEARKSVLAAGFSIHYSIYLQGREGTGNMLILTTSVP